MDRNSEGGKTHEAPPYSEPTPNPRQQRKIIAAISSGDPTILFHPDAEVSPSARRAFLESLRRGKPDDDKFKQLLGEIKSPLSFDRSNPQEVFSNMERDRQILGVISHFVKGKFNLRAEVTAADLGKFIEAFPDPMSFEKARLRFLELIEAQNGPAKRSEYEASLGRLGRAIYGKQQEYFDQIKFLKSEAMGKSDQKTGSPPNQDAKTHPEIKKADPNGHYRALGLNPLEVRNLSSEEFERVMKSAFREMSRRNHPDLGGQVEDMRRINIARDFLMNPANRLRYGR